MGRRVGVYGVVVLIQCQFTISLQLILLINRLTSINGIGAVVP
jgi:hypothetical protein